AKSAKKKRTRWKDHFFFVRLFNFAPARMTGRTGLCVKSKHEYFSPSVYYPYFSSPEISLFAILIIMAEHFSISPFVVIHEETLIRIAVIPFHTVPPHQQMPSS